MAQFFPLPPPADTITLPPAAFESIIARFGCRMLWRKSHLCPCTYASAIPGSPDPTCLTCFGKGTYWDAPSCNIFVGLVTFMHLSPTPDAPGGMMDTKFGFVQRAEPSLTIPYTAGKPWEEAAVDDLFIEVDALDRFQTQLVKGQQEHLPYQEQLCVAASGAVTVWGTTAKTVTTVSGYAVSGAVVTLPSSYESGTPYVVEFTAAKSYVAWRDSGSIAHSRPFDRTNQPKRFRLQTLDWWLRGLPNGRG